METGSLSLTELLTSVVDELYAAEGMRISKGRAGKVMVDQVELELKVTLSKEGGAGLKFHVLGAEFGGKKETISSIRVTLAPPRTGADREAGIFYTLADETQPLASHKKESPAWQHGVQIEAMRARLVELLDAAADEEWSGELVISRLREVLDAVQR